MTARTAARTDGQVAYLISRILRAALRGDDQTVQDVIALIENGEHPKSAEIVASIKADIDAQRVQYVAAGARRFFEFPLNWHVIDNELCHDDSAKVQNSVPG
ncbi:hypothetical protein OPU71_10125 [Niveibacterium sp. 24ML]|uniref:hypothetical protein n=1 Tax=Niveibacterium sp. 24ML TaxID=2985512 RepID=UPI00226E915E|nr:hypothetical protein [Niveibacterium sp. 24ML]MCX9156477.1 hypothetical protein [Niveibacterium sp. 24ML]